MDIECDLFKGRWVLDRRSLYMNSSCSAIPDLKNCIKLGTPDTDFLNWKWKPDGYDLPRFNPKGFLSMVQGKKMRFIGDSVAENHMKSLICLLSMTMVVKEDEAHHPYAFHVSGPSNVASPNWGDLINSSWKDPNYKRTIMGCIIQTAYLLELDRQENRIEQNAHAGLTLLSSYGSSNVCIEANSIRAVAVLIADKELSLPHRRNQHRATPSPHT
ncbi:predicted protein [Arabidopsis lyrata subsp. lyrata]|uniref:Predicted protein n=1 Tax=Arabidopsis lyrata subsp. lyrata TaxID=81972 RepID=D7LTG1_ARALL|nr:predicted protein [Arabidopsis lyrata subsp. lyrata]